MIKLICNIAKTEYEKKQVQKNSSSARFACVMLPTANEESVYTPNYQRALLTYTILPYIIIIFINRPVFLWYAVQKTFS